MEREDDDFSKSGRNPWGRFEQLFKQFIYLRYILRGMYSKCRSRARDSRVEMGRLTRGVESTFVWLKEKGGQYRESEGGA